MKNINFYIFLLLYILIIPQFLHAATDYSAKKVYGVYKSGNLTITSYSVYWDNEKLELLYKELKNNFHGDEFSLLKNIYIYADSPYGVNGYYYEDSTIDEYGNYGYGSNGYIELYNGDRYNSIEKIAPIIAHEYGHHYTFCNITKYENKYYSNWDSSEYVKIRGLEDLPVSYTYDENNYIYRWDIAEIAANDYVQLLGSKLSKASIDYYDTKESLERNLTEAYYSLDSFNLKPQDNPYIPLAADVDGLYEYMIKISGHISSQSKLSKKPIILSIDSYSTYLDSKSYKIKWSKAEGKGPFEYTVVMYPSNNPYMPVPIKTVNTGEALEATFGSDIDFHDDGSASVIMKHYEGEYIFKIYTKDKNGFIFSSEPKSYDFGNSTNFEDKVYEYTDKNQNDNKFTVKSMSDRTIKDVLQDTNVYFNNQKALIKPAFDMNISIKNNDIKCILYNPIVYLYKKAIEYHNTKLKFSAFT